MGRDLDRWVAQSLQRRLGAVHSSVVDHDQGRRQPVTARPEIRAGVPASGGGI
jgi:hypothetical protein